MFKKYNRISTSEMREVTQRDIDNGCKWMRDHGISVSIEDMNNGSPKIGDMIARNPTNHQDQWLVSEEYFKNNFKG